MEKIISLFQRDYDGDRLVRNEVVPGAEWVIAGEGVATRKWDGTCCLVRDGKLFKRYHCNEGQKLPAGFELAERKEQKDIRGKDVVKLYGWVPVGDGPEDRWHREAVNRDGLADGTYELCGPKVQGNAENLSEHWLNKHGACILEDAPRTFDELKEYFADPECDIEGIVWHHPDGRMVKIKKKDFGFSRVTTPTEPRRG